MRRPAPIAPLPTAAATALLILCLGSGLAGCGTVGEDGGADIGLLGVPDPEAEQKPLLTAKEVGRLFPTGPGRQWEMAITFGPARPGATGDDAEVQRTRDVVRIERRSEPSPGTVEVRQSFSVDDKTHRRETYRVTSAGEILLVDSSDREVLRFNPPLPLVRADEPAGRRFRWDGKINFRGETAAAYAYGRLSDRRRVDTPMKPFEGAYRVDTVLYVITRGGAIALPSTRYFVPDVGIVRQTSFIGDKRLDKELLDYSE